MINPKTYLLAAISVCLISSCKKESATPDPQPKPNATKGFIWQEDGGSDIKADSAFWTTWSNGTGIRAYKNGMSHFFEINWSGAGATATGTYTLAPSGGVTFLNGNDTYTNSDKSQLAITAFSNEELSGNFTANLSGGGIRQIKVRFASLPKK